MLRGEGEDKEDDDEEEEERVGEGEPRLPLPPPPPGQRKLAGVGCFEALLLLVVIAAGRGEVSAARTAARLNFLGV